MFVSNWRRNDHKMRRLIPSRNFLTRVLILGSFVTCFALVAVYVVSAAIALSTSIAYTQSFDGMGIPATTATPSTLPADFRVDNPSTVRTVGTFAAASSTTARAGGANLSTTATNGIYNFGSGTTALGGSDRAVGFLSSGSATQSGNLYAHLTNNTGGNLAGLQISYDVEKYRSGLNPNGFRIQLFYSNDGTSWTNAGSDFFTSFPADANNNGFATAPGVTVPVSNKTLNVTIADGAAFYLAWNYSVAATTTTTNAQALAIDNVSILGIAGGGSTDPSGIGAATPAVVAAGSSTLLTVSVTPGTNPSSTNLMVSGDLTSIGGSNNQPFYDDGTNGDAAADDNTFSFLATVSNATSGGGKILPFTVSDAEARSSGGSISLTVQAPADHVVISQIYGGGGNSGAPFTHDYVELYNPTSNTVTISGWSLQYGPATQTNWLKQPLGGFIAPGQYYLVRLASGGAVGSPLPVDPNISGDINISATTGKIALVSNSDFVVGACPVPTDADIVDFVGYGSNANCREGSANAPSPSNSTAIYRQAGGLTDTDQNGADFSTASPSPRRTAPIVELGPWVAGTDPTTNDTVIPRDASITINFSEPVNVVGAWYNIACASTGTHNDATVASTSDLETYVITPNVNFQFSEQCTVTINKDGIHDVDTDDSDPNSDTLFENYVWSFTVVGPGLPALYEPSVHLAFGNPSNAVTSLLEPNNYLMEKPAFSLSYNKDKGIPNWVSWHLELDWTGSLTRVDTFRPDPAVQPDWYRVQAFDYSNSGFDRGHMTPNADRDHQDRIPLNQETFLMTNIIPQAPDNNQGPWANFENYLRTQLTGPDRELYIVAGGVGEGGTGSSGFTTTIADGHVSVPSDTWKVVLVLSKGDDDISRVTAATRTIAIMMPNVQGIRTSNPNDWMTYLTTVDAVEQATGYNFFANVPDAIENAIEAGTNGTNPPGTEDQSVTTAEDNSKAVTLTAVSPQTMPTFTFTVVNGPTNGLLSGTGANLTYQPNPDFNGTDSFTFKANDGSQDSNVSTVNITITAVNDAPVANNDAYSTNSNITLNVTAPGVLGNDVDVDSVSLSVELVSDASNGTLTLNPNGSFSYDPADDYTGPDSFTYRVFDGAAYSNDATVNITVNDTVAPDLSSTIGMSSLSVTNGNLVNVGLTATATDNGGGPVTIQVAVFGDEDDQTPTIGTTVHSPDAKDIAPLTLRLRGERVEANDGRVYLIIVTATDNVGNISRAYHTVVVPKNNKPGNVNSVNAQAAAAKAYAEANGVAPPTYFIIGDGPIIGPKQ